MPPPLASLWRLGVQTMARILIVDDEPPVREILVRLVVAAGHETAEADTAEAAIELMAANPAAVAFCDVEMPGRGGLWLAAEIRKRHPDVAIVLATGVSTVPPAISLRTGVVAYLLKPFGRTEVLAAVGQGLAWHEQAVAGGPATGEAASQLQEWIDGLNK